ncbi:DUF2380 domain-containing protein [Bradyrhizobium acaciae]|uniref:DUF2380 domain-containing protein n=1 Tax=Bradyrhizobium acaciae TaxID=2683706 RepID=UPI0030843949|nr:DUF2380 domain-containing protein [Bradyrhizobium acaciae]
MRDQLAQSGRYRLVDTAGAPAEPIKARALRDCGGPRSCDCATARRGSIADRRHQAVRRTEYTVGFQLRDARSGAVVSRDDSDLRMGADYSWTPGAVRLIGDRLLEGGAQRSV